MMERSRLILLDANVVIHLCGIGLWERVIEQCEVHLARTVVQKEVLSHNIKPYERDGRVHVFDVPASDAVQLRSRFDRGYFDRLDDGETESLVYLLKHQGDFRLSSADAIVFRVLANLQLVESGVSLEELLREIGLSRGLSWQFTEAFRRKYSTQGTEERIRGIGLKSGLDNQQT